MTYEELPTLAEFGQILDRRTIVQMVQIAEANQQIKTEEIMSAWSEIWGRVQHPEFYEPSYAQLEYSQLNAYRRGLNAGFKVGSKSINRLGRARGQAVAGTFGNAVDQVIYLISARYYQFPISQATVKTFLTAWQPILNSPQK